MGGVDGVAGRLALSSGAFPHERCSRCIYEMQNIIQYSCTKLYISVCIYVFNGLSSPFAGEESPPFPPPPPPPLHPTFKGVGWSIFPPALSSCSNGQLEGETQTSDREGSPGKFSMQTGGGAEEGAAGDAAQMGATTD